jgi:hypothetical protein
MKNKLFVHGGFNRHERLEEQGDLLWWDRDLWSLHCLMAI